MIRQAWGPYKRLYSLCDALQVALRLGLGFGLPSASSILFFPIAVAKVTTFIFQRLGAESVVLRSHPELLSHGPKINSIAVVCLSIPAIMTVRSLCDYVNTYYMKWVSNKVLTDIRTQLFGKMLSHSMDFFNKMRSGFLMSRITNDTRMMQTALSSVSSDLFKQPVAIIGGVTGVLLTWIGSSPS